MMNSIRGFLAGFFSTLIFHQGLLGVIFLLKAFPKAPYSMAPTGPLGVPSVISLAFFGGLWGVVILKMVAAHSGTKQLIRWIIYGAIGPTLVAVTVVLPLKGVAFNPIIIPVGLLLNGVWGLGCYLLLHIRK